MSGPKFCIDRLLPSEEWRYQRTTDAFGVTRAILVRGKLWVNGSRLHVRFLGGSPQQRAKAVEQASWWVDQAAASITFVFDDAPDADIRVSFDPSDGAWSYIGTDCAQVPRNQPTMNLGFLSGGTAAHEFGHALGLGHEHQNPRGGIEWNEDRVIRDLSGPPNYWSVPQIRHNVLDRYAVDQIKGTEFDPDSIMLYFFPPSWTRDGRGTKANEVLSDLDKSYISSVEGYPGAGTPRERAKALTVGAPRRTRARIGKPGEEDLYSFAVAEGGRYLMDTRGATDLVMSLFGPDKATAFVASDDNNGVGQNPSIAADLTPGTYYLRIRHQDRGVSGVGLYTVKVQRPRAQH